MPHHPMAGSGAPPTNPVAPPGFQAIASNLLVLSQPRQRPSLDSSIVLHPALVDEAVREAGSWSAGA